METKEEFRTKIEAQLKEWATVLDDLKAKAEKTTTEVKSEILQEIKELKARRDKLQKQAKELGAASGDAVKILRKGMEQAGRDLKKAIDKARKRFK